MAQYITPKERENLFTLLRGYHEAPVLLKPSNAETGRFVELMNQEALKLGLASTHYVNPTGLDPDDGLEPNYSTAEDIAKLAVVIARNYPNILNIMSLKKFNLETAAGTFHHTLETTDKLLREPVPFRILGGKTGETPMAKKNLLLITASPRENSFAVVSVVLGSDDNFGDMKKLLTSSVSK